MVSYIITILLILVAKLQSLFANIIKYMNAKVQLCLLISFLQFNRRTIIGKDILSLPIFFLNGEDLCPLWLSRGLASLLYF